MASRVYTFRSAFELNGETNKIDTRIRKLAPVAQPLQIIAEVQTIH